MKKDKLTIKITTESEKYFVASDSIFYDYGVGYTIEACLLDYVTTIRERLEITKSNGNEKINQKLQLLRKMLQVLSRS